MILARNVKKYFRVSLTQWRNFGSLFDSPPCIFAMSLLGVSSVCWKDFDFLSILMFFSQFYTFCSHRLGWSDCRLGWSDCCLSLHSIVSDAFERLEKMRPTSFHFVNPMVLHQKVTPDSSTERLFSHFDINISVSCRFVFFQSVISLRVCR